MHVMALVGAIGKGMWSLDWGVPTAQEWRRTLGINTPPIKSKTKRASALGQSSLGTVDMNRRLRPSSREASIRSPSTAPNQPPKKYRVLRQTGHNNEGYVTCEQGMIVEAVETNGGRAGIIYVKVVETKNGGDPVETCGWVKLSKLAEHIDEPPPPSPSSPSTSSCRGDSQPQEWDNTVIERMGTSGRPDQSTSRGGNVIGGNNNANFARVNTSHNGHGRAGGSRGWLGDGRHGGNQTNENRWSTVRENVYAGAGGAGGAGGNEGYGGYGCDEGNGGDGGDEGDEGYGDYEDYGGGEVSAYDNHGNNGNIVYDSNQTNHENESAWPTSYDCRTSHRPHLHHASAEGAKGRAENEDEDAEGDEHQEYNNDIKSIAVSGSSQESGSL